MHCTMIRITNKKYWPITEHILLDTYDFEQDQATSKKMIEILNIINIFLLLD